MDKHPAPDYIKNVLVPEWLEQFLEKAKDYNSTDFEPHRLLGERGQFADIWRKIWKLKKALWDGETLIGEQPREIIQDLISHCFLTLELMDQSVDQAGHWPDCRREDCGGCMQINETENGIVYPCQPIGCDAGKHIPGCFYEKCDTEEKPWTLPAKRTVIHDPSGERPVIF